MLYSSWFSIYESVRAKFHGAPGPRLGLPLSILSAGGAAAWGAFEKGCVQEINPRCFKMNEKRVNNDGDDENLKTLYFLSESPLSPHRQTEKNTFVNIKS